MCIFFSSNFIFLIILFSWIVEFLKIRILSFNSIFLPSLGPINARGWDETDPQNLSSVNTPTTDKTEEKKSETNTPTTTTTQNKTEDNKTESSTEVKTGETQQKETENKEKKELIVPKGFISHLVMISIGTTRGVLHSKTENTIYNKFLLPTINVNELIKEDVKFNIL